MDLKVYKIMNEIEDLECSVLKLVSIAAVSSGDYYVTIHCKWTVKSGSILDQNIIQIIKNNL